MAGNKYVSVDGNGNQAEVAASQTSAGAGDAGKIPALNGAGKIDESMLPDDATNSIASSENMTAPCLVNVWNNSGTQNVRYADASAANASKRAVGFLVDSVISPAAVNVHFEVGAIIPGWSSLTPGAKYFLSDSTPGGITTTPVTASGHLLQPVGTAISTTELRFEPEDGVIRA